MKQPWPEVGQVWKDVDPRMTGRTIKVIEAAGNRVVVEVLTDRDNIIMPTVGRQFDLLAVRLMAGAYELQR